MKDIKKIIRGETYFRFIDGDQEYIIAPKPKGYKLSIVKDNQTVIVLKKEKLSLDKLNAELPEAFQFTKDDIIFCLVAEKVE